MDWRRDKHGHVGSHEYEDSYQYSWCIPSAISKCSCDLIENGGKTIEQRICQVMK